MFNFKHRMEEFTIVFLIMLDVIDFMHLLPPDVDFIKRVVSWVLLGYLLYELSVTKLLFGEKKNHWDIILILTYFILVFKHIITFAEEAIKTESVFIDFYNLIIIHKATIAFWSFNIGCVLIIILSIWFSIKAHVKKPSLIHVLHEEGIPKTIRKKIERFVIIFLILNAFFILIFNLMMEWLAVAIDASLTVLVIIFYLFTAFRRHFKKFHTESIIYKVGDASEKFYVDFIGLFHSHERIFLGFSGILVLHLLTDIANFIIPYLTGYGSFYLSGFNALHRPIMELFLQDIISVSSVLEMISLTWIYIFNTIAIILFLFLPSYIWYKVYKQSGFKTSKIELAIFSVSAFVFLAKPIFLFKALDLKNMVGVDVQTIALSGGSNLIPVFFMSILLGILVYVCSYNHYMKEKILILSLIVIAGIFAIYVFDFFSSNLTYYISTINSMMSTSYIILAFFFFIFLLMTSLLYVAGFMIFILETKKEYRYIR